LQQVQMCTYSCIVEETVLGGGFVARATPEPQGLQTTWQDTQKQEAH
jgi:hypothetical protein